MLFSGSFPLKRIKFPFKAEERGTRLTRRTKRIRRKTELFLCVQNLRIEATRVSEENSRLKMDIAAATSTTAAVSPSSTTKKNRETTAPPTTVEKRKKTGKIVAAAAASLLALLAAIALGIWRMKLAG